MSLLSSSENLTLKMRLRFMKGSMGSSRRYSKPLQKSYCKTQICRVLFMPEVKIPDASLPCFTYCPFSSIGFYYQDWEGPSVLCSLARKDRSSMTLKTLGCFPTFSLRLFTKALSTPTPSCMWAQKSKPCCSAILSWQQQSSRVFLGTPSMLAASGRLTFFLFLGPPAQVSCIARHSLTKSMASPIVRSLLRSSRELPFRCGQGLSEYLSSMKVGQRRETFTFWELGLRARKELP